MGHHHYLLFKLHEYMPVEPTVPRTIQYQPFSSGNCFTIHPDRIFMATGCVSDVFPPTVVDHLR